MTSEVTRADVGVLLESAAAASETSPIQAVVLTEGALDLAKMIGSAELEAWVEMLLGVALYRLDGWEEDSVLHLRRAVSLAPMSCASLNAWAHLGDVLKHLGRRREAVEAYAESLELDELISPLCPEHPLRTETERRHRELRGKLGN